jgi:hypothetical protein
MNRLLFAAAFALVAVPVHATDVGVSISVGQPGFYGQIDIGGYPAPRVLYSQPRVMYRSALHRAPIYLHVPPGHAKNWRKHCRQYNACGERVYFVQNNWYSNEYVPHYQQRHGDRRDDSDQGGRGDDRRDHDRSDRGNGNGNGNDKGHSR